CAGADAAKAAEEAAGTADVGGDLGAELFGVGEFAFGAEVAPEFELDALGINGAGEIEQMGFDGEGSAVESGTHADVGDGAASARFAFEKSAGDVDAARGEQFLFRLKV